MQISPDDRLRAFALFTMAVEHAQKAREFQEAMMSLLCVDEANYLSDALWSTERASTRDFDAALSKDGFEVKPDQST